MYVHTKCTFDCWRGKRGLYDFCLTVTPTHYAAATLSAMIVAYIYFTAPPDWPLLPSHLQTN